MRRKIAFSIIAVAALAVWTAGPACAASGWVLQSAPSTAEPVTALNGVSCVSASYCQAVGYDSGGTLAEEWNGSTWTIQPTPGAGSPDELDGVSCVSASYCQAVGSTSAGILTVEWDGSGWTGAPEAVPGISLLGVSCVSASYCEAVGRTGSGAIAAYWNGYVWASQGVSAPTGALLNSVSCVTVSNCTAVGYYGPNASTRGLAEHWNGSTWTAETFVQEGADTLPFSVSCTSATSCLAVGAYYSTDATYQYALAERWNGSTWTADNGSSPNDQAAFFGVSCLSAADCSATGVYNTNQANTGANLTLAESWNGSSWTTQSTPNPSGADGAGLLSASCPSATDCTAVGAWSGSDLSDAKVLAEQWTG
jgi:hypothetical protein